MSNLEKNTSKSPLLSEAVIERDYTKGIEKQISGGQPSPSVAPIQPAPPIQGQQQQQQSSPQPDQSTQSQAGGFEAPKGFTFDEEITDASDITGDEPLSEGFELATGSAKTFANVIGDLIKIKVPEISFNFCKIDIASIEIHVQRGNIHEAMRDVVRQVNDGTREALEFTEDEIKMWKKAFKEYLEYKNIKTANPETAFWIATGVLVLTQGLKVRELGKRNTKLVHDAIYSYNPGFFDSYEAKTGTKTAPEEAKVNEKTTEKTKM